MRLSHGFKGRKRAKLALPMKSCSQANLCVVITGLCRILFSIVLHLRVADVQIVCVHLRACVIVRRYVDLVSREFLILWVCKFQFRFKTVNFLLMRYTCNKNVNRR